jgi:predicted RNA-binding protein YlxR (DUF448 family)
VLCKRRFAMQELLRISRDADGALRIRERGGRGVWVCSGSHEAGLRAGIRQGLRGPVSDEEIDVIDQARRAWIKSTSERRGA